MNLIHAFDFTRLSGQQTRVLAQLRYSKQQTSKDVAIALNSWTDMILQQN